MVKCTSHTGVLTEKKPPVYSQHISCKLLNNGVFTVQVANSVSAPPGGLLNGKCQPGY